MAMLGVCAPAWLYPGVLLAQIYCNQIDWCCQQQPVCRLSVTMKMYADRIVHIRMNQHLKISPVTRQDYHAAAALFHHLIRSYVSFVKYEMWHPLAMQAEPHCSKLPCLFRCKEDQRYLFQPISSFIARTGRP